MNPEKYKSEMLRQHPDRAFVEITLAKAQKETTPRKKEHHFLKAAGGIGLSAAVLVGAFFGAGAVRSLFKDINTQEVEEIIESNPVISEEKEIENRITATDDILAVTPLSNPKYTVKANTPDGKVSLDEYTTPAEMLACGVAVETDNGVLGMQYICEALRKYKNAEAFEFILGNAMTYMGDNTYHYYNYKPRVLYPDSSNCRYWFYDHRYGQSISKYSRGIDFAELRANAKGDLLGITVNKAADYSMTTGLVTTYDTYKVTGFDKEQRKSMFYKNVTEGNDMDNPRFLNVIYNGECAGSYRMNLFIDRIADGEEYVSVQFTDITTTDEYDERFYSIEYCQGVYSIFTMTDGLNGKFDTQYFDGCTVSDGKAVFENGKVSYAFMLSENAEADAVEYGDILFDNGFSGYAVRADMQGEKNLRPFYDEAYVRHIYKENILGLLVIDEKHSTDEYTAVKVQEYWESENHEEYRLQTDSSKSLLGKGNSGDNFYLSDVRCISDGELKDRFINENDEMLLLLTDDELEIIKNSAPGVMQGVNDITLERVWSIHVFVALYEK